MYTCVSAFSLHERIGIYVLIFAGTLSDEAVFQKVIKILNETVGAVFEYLRDAKVLYIYDNIKLLGMSYCA